MSAAQHRTILPDLPPQVWQGSHLAESDGVCVASGHAALDAQLPGGGWPEGGLIELLQAQPCAHAGAHAWRLLLPALAQAVRQHAGPVVLVGPPQLPFGPSLRSGGLPQERLLLIRDAHGANPAGEPWAVEQALRCAEVAAVLAWLPRARQGELRRLHLASHQQGRLFFVFRPASAAAEASPARLRLEVQESVQGGGQGAPQGVGQGVLRVHILKRRGPPLASPVLLPAQAGRLAELLRARQTRGAQEASVSSPVPSRMPAFTPLFTPIAAADDAGADHALDRLALPG